MANKSKRTPEPWTANAINGGAWFHVSGTGPDFVMVAEIMGKTPRHKADAFLIAQSPAMLAILRDLISTVKNRDAVTYDDKIEALAASAIKIIRKTTVVS